MRRLVILLLGLAVVSALPKQARIVAGTETTIEQYPHIVALIERDAPYPFRQLCGGSIINNRSILTAAHCLAYPFSDTLKSTTEIRSRLGSSSRSSGGLVYNSREFIVYPGSLPDLYYDIAVIRVVGEIFETDVIKYGLFAGPNYFVPDNARLWAAGWGARYPTDSVGPDQLHHVEAYHVNREVCNRMIAQVGYTRRVPEHQMCFGQAILTDGDGPSQCTGDSGSPLHHNGIIVGVTAWMGMGCGNPTVNDRVPYYIGWIEQNR